MVTEAYDRMSMVIYNLIKIEQIIVLGLVLIVLFAGDVLAQQNQAPSPGTSSKPLELPNFII